MREWGKKRRGSILDFQNHHSENDPKSPRERGNVGGRERSHGGGNEEGGRGVPEPQHRSRVNKRWKRKASVGPSGSFHVAGGMAEEVH